LTVYRSGPIQKGDNVEGSRDLVAGLANPLRLRGGAEFLGNPIDHQASPWSGALSRGCKACSRSNHRRFGDNVHRLTIVPV